jgi:hypothetical protein
MTILVDAALTGGAQTGFTSPVYNTVADKAPDVNSSQVAVTSLGGTQTGVRSHSISDPFTITISKPKSPATLPSPNPVTGKYPNIPYNRTSIVVRKGVNYAASQSPLTAVARVYLDVPAGSDAYDAANIRAMVSALVGLINDQSAGIGDTAVTGIVG